MTDKIPEGATLIAEGAEGWRAYLVPDGGQDWRAVQFWRAGAMRAQFGWNGQSFGRSQNVARVPLAFRDRVVHVLRDGRALGVGHGQARKRKDGRTDALAGAYLDRWGNWYSIARVNGRPVYLGRFPDEQSAHGAWAKAKGARQEPDTPPSVFD